MTILDEGRRSRRAVRPGIMAAMPNDAPRPFRLEIAPGAIADLHARLDRARWPDEAPPSQGAPWAFGTSLAFMRELVHEWRHRYDWRATEAALNAWPQFKTRIGDIDIHYLHVPGKGQGAQPAPRRGRCCCRTAGRARCSSSWS
jgi:hypothetical protein